MLSSSRGRVNAAGQGYSLELLRNVGVRHPAGRGINALVAGYVRGMRECTLVPDRGVLASGAIIRSACRAVPSVHVSPNRSEIDLFLTEVSIVNSFRVRQDIGR